MKKALLITAAAAMTLTGTLAQAQGYDRDDRREARQERRADRQDYRQDRREDRREFRQYQRGQRLEAQYRNQNHIVSDYGRYGLSAPPRGYQYYRSGNNVLLTAIASGLIGAVISNVLQNRATGYSQPSYGYSQPSYGYQQPAYGYGQPSYGYQQPYGYQRPIRGYDQYGRPYY